MRIATLVLLFAAAARTKAAPVDYELPDITVHTKYGDFVFTKMKIRTQVGVLGKDAHFTGDIENRTGHNWIGPSFAIDVTDAKSRRFDGRGSPSAFNFVEFAKGEVKQFDYATLRLIFKPVETYARYTLDEHTIVVQEISLKTGDIRASYRFALESPVKTDGDSFEDDLISITIYPAETQLGFTLRNKSVEPIKVLWDQCAYVDRQGQSLRVIHSGIRFLQKGDPMPPSLIPPGALLKEAVTPVDYIAFVPNEDTGWQLTTKMFPMTFAEAAQFTGTAVSMFIPVEIKGSTHNYTFKLRTKDVVAD